MLHDLASVIFKFQIQNGFLKVTLNGKISYQYKNSYPDDFYGDLERKVKLKAFLENKTEHAKETSKDLLL